MVNLKISLYEDEAVEMSSRKTIHKIEAIIGISKRGFE